MEKLILLTMVLLLNVKSEAQQQKVFFDSDSYRLSAQEKQKLDKISDAIKNNFKNGKISIIGFTDSDAANEYNTKLALKRAEVVKKYLINAGIESEFFLFSKGESELIVGNDQQENKEASRRVIIDFNYQEKNRIEEVARNKENVFVVSATKDTIITCDNGTKIQISKDVFDTPFKSIPIIVKVEEYLEKEDFIFAGLNTMDDKGKLIESRGMINVTAYQRGREIKVKQDRNFYILFKDRIEGDSTQLFYGKRRNNDLVWELAKDSLVKKRKHYPEFYTRKKIEFGHSVVVGRLNNENVYYHDKIDTSYYEKFQYPQTDFSRANTLAMSSTQTGWINCDRFVNDDREKMDVIVKNTGNEDANVVLFFSDLNSMMAPVLNLEGYLTFKNVPVGSKVSIIGVYAKDEVQPMDVAFITTELDPKKEYVLNYKKMDVTTFKTALKKV